MTIAGSVTVQGIGLHTGASVSVTLHPAEAKSGLVFRSQGVSIPARTAFVVDTSRCTVLGTEGSRVSTVEHLLSACAGHGISDLCIEVEGPELPIGDGGAALWCAALAEAGMAGEPSPGPVLREPLVVTGKNGQFIAAYPSASLCVTVAAVFDHPMVGTQIARYAPSQGDDYTRDIAPSRTFGFIEEVEALQKAGLALGGSLENAVVAYPDHYSVPLRFPNEMARHKLLDVLGDLLLTGYPNLPQADIIAVKPSHQLNVAFAARFAEICS